jgi:hypothetical protein
MSRLGRDYLQVGMYTDVIFPEFGVHFVAVNDGVDSTRGDNEFTAIRNVFNEMFARDTSKKIRATFQSKGKSGEHLSTNAPFGYRKDPGNTKKWLVDEEAAAIVQKIYALCIDGLGPTQIGNQLQKNSILCPSAYWQSKGVNTPAKVLEDPCKWDNSVISDILERLEYLGHTVNFKVTTQSYKSKKVIHNSSDKWSVFENTHEPIIEESVFVIVQNLRKDRKRPTRMGEMGMFSGLLYCADCGGRMYLCRTTNFKPEQQYYICSTYRKGRELCTTHTIRNVVLEEIVLQNLREAVSFVSQYEEEFVREASDVSLREQDKELSKKRDELKKTESRISELDSIIKRMYEDNVSGKLSDERFVKLSREYEQEQGVLRYASDALSRELKGKEQQKGNVKNFIAAVKKYTDLKELDATVLREFIERIYISPVVCKTQIREVEIVYNFIGAFDFGAALAQAQNQTEQQKSA